VTTPVWLISRREVIGRVRRRSFVVFTLLLCAVIIGGGILFSVLNDDDRPTHDIGVVADSVASEQLGTALVAVGDANGADVAVVPLVAADVEPQLAAGEIDVAVDVTAGSATWQGDVDDEVAAIVDAAWRA